MALIGQDEVQQILAAPFARWRKTVEPEEIPLAPEPEPPTRSYRTPQSTIDAFWFVGVFVVALLFFWHPNPLVAVIALLGGYELFHRWGKRNDPQWKAYNATTWGQRVAVGVVYLGLIAVLVVAMEVSYLHRTF